MQADGISTVLYRNFNQFVGGAEWSYFRGSAPGLYWAMRDKGSSTDKAVSYAARGEV